LKKRKKKLVYGGKGVLRATKHFTRRGSSGEQPPKRKPGKLDDREKRRQAMIKD